MIIAYPFSGCFYDNTRRKGDKNLLFDDITKLQNNWPGFNARDFSVTELLRFAGRRNVIALEDATIASACTFCHNGETIILYNPHRPHAELILAIGHELGHIGLGHVTPDGEYLYANFFETEGIERDAGTVGFLFWQPTAELIRLDMDGRLDIEEVYKHHKAINGSDVPEEDLVKFCRNRLRIFEGLKRTWR